MVKLYSKNAVTVGRGKKNLEKGHEKDWSRTVS